MRPSVRYRVRRGAAWTLLLLGAGAPAAAQSPTIAYTLRVDSARRVLDVAVRLRGVPPHLLLAMKVHPEYDARYWRFLDSLRVDQTADDHGAAVVRQDSTVWRVTLPGGRGVLRYRVVVQQPPRGPRRSWQTYLRADGALLNPPDCLLYLPQLAGAPVTLDLEVPAGWRVATALAGGRAPTRLRAPDAATLLDSPILLGTLQEWTYTDRGTRYHAAYWPLPDAVPFDTSAFLDGLRRLTRATVDVFGRAPVRDYWFLVQDGAGDALEHAASLTFGLPSAELARDPRARLPELAHEFFHTWNLVAIRPAGYNDLRYLPPAPTPGLWLGEGVTMHYAEVLPRRAGLSPAQPSRLDHLAGLLERYYGSPAIQRVSPERASLAFGKSPATDPDATGGYYLQGELLAEVLDARLREATHERHGLDDLMRLLFARSQAPGYHGYSSRDVVAAADAVCGCALDDFFARQVRGAGPIDPAPVLSRLALRLDIDTLPAADGAGRPLPDLRLSIDFTAPPGMLRLVLGDSTSPWTRAGLRTGDVLISLDGTTPHDFGSLRAVLQRLHIGERVDVEVLRGDAPRHLVVDIAGYSRPRVRFTELPQATPAQRARRKAWLRGY